MGEWALTRAKERLKDDELSDAQNKPKASGRLFKGNWCDQDVIFFIKKNHFLISSAYSPALPFPPKCFGVYLFTDFYRLKAVFVSTVSLHSSVKQQQLWDRTWEREKKKSSFLLDSRRGSKRGTEQMRKQPTHLQIFSFEVLDTKTFLVLMCRLRLVYIFIKLSEVQITLEDLC